MAANILTLETYVNKAAEISDAAFVVQGKGVVPPNTLENMRKLYRLGLLNGDVLLSLIGQAPIDPNNIFAALQSFGPWAFQPLDFTAISILAKKAAQPVALMRVDLMSDNITFVVLRQRQLVTHSEVSGVSIGEDLPTFLTAIRRKVQEVIDEGMANSG